MKHLSFFLLFFLLPSYKYEVFTHTNQEILVQSNIPLPSGDTWKERLEFARQITTSTTRPTPIGVTLTGYTYREKINSKEQIKELLNELFSDSTYVVKYPGSQKYEIVPLGQIKEEIKKNGSPTPYQHLKEELSKALKIGMEIIDVEWEYRGKKIPSITIAYDKKKGILYDHIGSMTIIPETQTDKESTSDPCKFIKTRQEDNGNIKKLYFDLQREGGMEIIGYTTWRCHLQCISFLEWMES